MNKPLLGRVCLVTGASHGIGRGIAVGLGEAGATVYITGRTLDSLSSDPEFRSQSLKETARLIEECGGKAIPIAVDHSDDSQVACLFRRIHREQQGRLDVLVNNAFAATEHLSVPPGGQVSAGALAYWEPSPMPSGPAAIGAPASTRTPAEEWDLVNRVGLRNTYTCCALATRQMVDYSRLQCSEQKRTPNGDCSPGGQCRSVAGQLAATRLIVNISSLGGTVRVFNVAFCAGKSALDRMTVEMARDLRSRGINDIAVISLIPELVGTELLTSTPIPAEVKDLEVSLGVPPILPGQVVAALAGQPQRSLLRKSGRCLLLSEQAREFRLQYTPAGSASRRYPASPRAVKTLLWLSGWRGLSRLVPEFVTVPFWLILLLTSKF